MVFSDDDIVYPLGQEDMVSCDSCAGVLVITIQAVAWECSKSVFDLLLKVLTRCMC